MSSTELGRRISERLRSDRPPVGIVLGSGLGGLGDRFESPLRIPYRELPGWPHPRVSGHAGVLLAGDLAGTPVIALSGRAHLYEGHAPEAITFPIRMLGRLGTETLIVSNAAGIVNPRFRPGDLMLIGDHIDLTWRSPLAGPPREGEVRFPDMCGCYDPGLRDLTREVAGRESIRLREGVYAGMLGPSYETPAEIRLLSSLGVDAVGMSTVPEVIVARARGMRCLGLSCLTNPAAGVMPGHLEHEEVVETAARTSGVFERLVLAILGRMT